MKNYNKVVRDLVPGMLRASGRKVVTRTIYGQELQKALRAKVDEELAEYDAAPDDEHAAAELVDVLETVLALAKGRGFTEAKIGQLRAAKTAQNGAFDLGILLVSTD